MEWKRRHDCYVLSFPPLQQVRCISFMEKRKQQTDRFLVETVSGKRYTIIETTTQTSFTSTNDGVRRWANGSIDYQTDNGAPVNWISETQVEIVLTDEVATRI